MANHCSQRRDALSERMLKRHHIIQVSSYYPPHLGGQENAVHDLAHHLAANGHSVQVLASRQGGGAKTEVRDRVHVRRLSSFVFGHAPIMPGFVGALLRMARPSSIVHVHIGQAFSPEMVWLAAKLRRFPFIAQLHIDFEPTGAAGFLLPLYKKYVLKPVLRAATTVIVLNEKTRTTVQQYGCRNVRIMNNGIDEAYFAAQRATLAPRPPDILRLVCVGRLSKQKNITTLLEALPHIARKVHLDIIGEGEERAAIEATITRLKLRNVTLHGRLPREEVRHFYQHSDALIMPSIFEAQPLVLLEAMATGIPIIGTNVIGVGEHIENIGIIAEPTPKGLAEAISKYDALHPDLPAMVNRGRAKAETLRWSQLLTEYETLYAEAAS